MDIQTLHSSILNFINTTDEYVMDYSFEGDDFVYCTEVYSPSSFSSNEAMLEEVIAVIKLYS